MRQRAIDRGLRLNEFGLIPEEKPENSRAWTQPSLSRLLTNQPFTSVYLPMSHPNSRGHGRSGGSTGERPPSIIETSHIKGALHNHTMPSDGEASLEMMADTARKWMNWLGIGDHSPTPKIANGASAEDLQQGRTIKQYNAEWANDGVDFRLFMGLSPTFRRWKTRPSRRCAGRTRLRGGQRSRHDPAAGRIGKHRGIDAGHRPSGDQRAGTPYRPHLARMQITVDLFAVLEHMAEHNDEGRLKAIELTPVPTDSTSIGVCVNTPRVWASRRSTRRSVHTRTSDIAYGVMTARKG